MVGLVGGHPRQTERGGHVCARTAARPVQRERQGAGNAEGRIKDVLCRRFVRELFEQAKAKVCVGRGDFLHLRVSGHGGGADRRFGGKVHSGGSQSKRRDSGSAGPEAA